jgi:hypothetical protein
MHFILVLNRHKSNSAGAEAISCTSSPRCPVCCMHLISCSHGNSGAGAGAIACTLSLAGGVFAAKHKKNKRRAVALQQPIRVLKRCSPEELACVLSVCASASDTVETVRCAAPEWGYLRGSMGMGQVECMWVMLCAAVESTASHVT